MGSVRFASVRFGGLLEIFGSVRFGSDGLPEIFGSVRFGSDGLLEIFGSVRFLAFGSAFGSGKENNEKKKKK